MWSKQKGSAADTYYDIDSNDITNARIKEIDCLIHECFLNFCDDSSCSETISGGARSKSWKQSSLKSAPGKKCRRGENPKRSYCNIGFIPGVSSIILDLETEQ
jgi:hypothetical protein